MPRSQTSLSFCEVGDRLIFLDVDADRYFCLSSPAEAAFRETLRPTGCDDARRGQGDGATVGVLDIAGRSVAAVCGPRPLPPEESLLEGLLPQASPAQAGRALARLAQARLRLKAIGLRRTIAAYERVKARRADAHNADLGELRRTMAGYARVGRFATTLDDCLNQSLAVAVSLAARGLAPQLVFGVRLGPFAAHAWVQQGRRLVNDRLDTVRDYTPILVV